MLGLAREGVDLARFLALSGARVTVTDQKPAEELGPRLGQLDGLDIQYALGNPPAEELLQSTDVLFASPGVPPSNPLIAGARERGVPTSSLVELFFQLCPGRIVGITGSAGKTTTTSLLGEMFRAAGRDVFIGGNIGKPLLGELDRISPESWVVMELSSFQLEFMRQSPPVALVTNVTPNHLDRHPTMEAYWEAKGQILAHQDPRDWAVLNADDAWSRKFRPRGRMAWFSLERPVEGAYLEGDVLRLMASPLLRLHEIRVPGRHNVANVLAAAATAHVSGIERGAIADAALAFRGVPHRLQEVGQYGGVRFVNDSIATAPERSTAGLRAFQEPVVLIAGGADKNFSDQAMRAWAHVMVERCRHVVLLGRMAPKVRAALAAVAPGYSAVHDASSMAEAVRAAAAAARTGDIVLLSPGGTSYDMYRDFEERGDDFSRCVQEHRA